MALLKYLDSLRYLPQIFLCKLPSISMRYQNCSKQISNCNPVSEKILCWCSSLTHSHTHFLLLYCTFYFCIKTTLCFSRNSEEEKNISGKSMENFNEKYCVPVYQFCNIMWYTEFMDKLNPILCKICIQIELEKSIKVLKYLMWNVAPHFFTFSIKANIKFHEFLLTF